MSARKFCCGPMTEPGLHRRSQPMSSVYVRLWCFIRYSAISVPVRPSPALQCTASAPFSVSQTWLGLGLGFGLEVRVRVRVGIRVRVRVRVRVMETWLGLELGLGLG